MPKKAYPLPPPKSEASGGPLSLKDYEIYSGIELPQKPFFVRLDGWAFHHLTKKLKLKKPFDRFLAKSLANTAKEFFILFNPTLAYIFSDEINFFFLKPTSFQRIEKIDSLFAGYASSIFYSSLSKKYKQIPKTSFDCRTIPLNKNLIQKYLIWRQAECFRNSNNSYAQHILIKQGYSPRKAAKQLTGLNTQQLRALINKKIKLTKIPLWHERGILLYWQPYKKPGYDPIKKKKVIVQRRKVIIDWNPIKFNTKPGKEFLKKIIK